MYGNLGPGHIRAEEYQLLYSPQELRKLYKFTFVRNPWDRLASAFFFLRSGGMNDLDQDFAVHHLAPFANFEQFVMDWLDRENIYLYDHFRPQTYYLNVNNRRMKLDFVGRYERLAQDFTKVCRRLGLVVELAWANRTQADTYDYKSLYNEAMIERVANVYADDIKSLRYRFA